MYKVNEPIIIIYQASGTLTGQGDTIVCDVYDESQTKDEGLSLTEMTEIGITGRYYATFIPDAVGEWLVEIENTAGGEIPSGKATVGYRVKEADIGDIATVDGKVDTISGKIDALSIPPQAM